MVMLEQGAAKAAMIVGYPEIEKYLSLFEPRSIPMVNSKSSNSYLHEMLTPLYSLKGYL